MKSRQLFWSVCITAAVVSGCSKPSAPSGGEAASTTAAKAPEPAPVAAPAPAPLETAPMPVDPHAGHNHGPGQGHGEDPANVPRITVPELQTALEKGEVVLLDTRAEPVFNQSHIKGAQMLNSPDVQAKLNAMKRDQLIVTYCT